MKYAAIIGAVAILITAPAVAQDRFSSRGGGFDQQPAPDEQRDPQGHYNYMVAHGYCAESAGLHPAWHRCTSDDQHAVNPDQNQRVQGRYDKINNDPRLGLGNAWAQSQGVRPYQAGPPQSNYGTGIKPFGKSYVHGSNYNNGTNYYPGYEPHPGTIVQRPPQSTPGAIVRPREIVRPKGFLLRKNSSQAAK